MGGSAGLRTAVYLSGRREALVFTLSEQGMGSGRMDPRLGPHRGLRVNSILAGHEPTTLQLTTHDLMGQRPKVPVATCRRVTESAQYEACF